MKSYIATIAITSALAIPVVIIKQKAQARSIGPQPTAIADAVEAKTGSQEQRGLTRAEQGHPRQLVVRNVRAAAVQISPVLYEARIALMTGTGRILKPPPPDRGPSRSAAA